MCIHRYKSNVQFYEIVKVLLPVISNYSEMSLFYLFNLRFVCCLTGIPSYRQLNKTRAYLPKKWCLWKRKSAHSFTRMRARKGICSHFENFRGTLSIFFLLQRDFGKGPSCSMTRLFTLDVFFCNFSLWNLGWHCKIPCTNITYQRNPFHRSNYIY